MAHAGRRACFRRPAPAVYRRRLGKLLPPLSGHPGRPAHAPPPPPASRNPLPPTPPATTTTLTLLGCVCLCPARPRLHLSVPLSLPFPPRLPSSVHQTGTGRHVRPLVPPIPPYFFLCIQPPDRSPLPPHLPNTRLHARPSLAVPNGGAMRRMTEARPAGRPCRRVLHPSPPPPPRRRGKDGGEGSLRAPPPRTPHLRRHAPPPTRCVQAARACRGGQDTPSLHMAKVGAGEGCDRGG